MSEPKADPEAGTLDVSPIQQRQKARRKIEHLHGSLCLSAVEGQQASNDCEELLAEVAYLRAALRLRNKEIAVKLAYIKAHAADIYAFLERKGYTGLRDLPEGPSHVE